MTDPQGDVATTIACPRTPADDEETVVVTRYAQSGEAARRALHQSSSYELMAELGRGAMGEVFIARDRQLLHKVAFKQMTAELMENAELSGRFFNEAQVTAQLDHPNIVPIYGLQVNPDGSLGYAMKLVRGTTLTDVIEQAREAAEGSDWKAERKRLTERLEVFLAVCAAMHFAHRRGVLHRDLKPDNIMVGDDGVYVMDWGICRLIGSDEVVASEPADGAPEETRDDAGVRVSPAPGESDSYMGSTEYGAVIGTPAYMSPEQAQGKVLELDERSDLYSLGLILHELVTLRRARRARTRDLQGKKPPGSVGSLVHHHRKLPVPVELEAIVHKATQALPQDRYANVGELADDVRAYLRGDPVAARPDTPPQALARWVGNHKRVALGIMVALLLAGSGATIASLWHSERQLALEKHRDHEMDALFVQVVEQAYTVDRYLLQIEKALSRLAGGLEQAAVSPPGEVHAVYSSDDYAQPGMGPPDLVASPYYGRAISIDHAVVKLAPGVSEADVAEDLQRLGRLRGAFEDLLRRSAGMGDETDRDQFRARLAGEGLPVIRTFVTLKNGIHVSFPGHGGYPTDYDGRLRPKYTLSEGKHGIQWGNPFRDRYGHGLALAASTSVVDANDQFIGVAGLEMTFERIVEQLLTLPRVPHVKEIYLVDEDGNVVLRALGGDVSPGGPAVPAGASAELDDTFDNRPVTLDALPYPSVKAVLADRQAGQTTVEKEGRASVVTYTPVYSLGWWYVVVADEAELLEPAVVP